jgi:hypothetical protein
LRIIINIITIIITDLEGTTRDPSVPQEAIQIHRSFHAKPMSAVNQSVLYRNNRYEGQSTL